MSAARSVHNPYSRVLTRHDLSIRWLLAGLGFENLRVTVPPCWVRFVTQVCAQKQYASNGEMVENNRNFFHKFTAAPRKKKEPKKKEAAAADLSLALNCVLSNYKGLNTNSPG
jgi:hypothetical protein